MTGHIPGTAQIRQGGTYRIGITVVVGGPEQWDATYEAKGTPGVSW